MGNCCAAAKPDQDDVERGGQETAGDSSPIQKVNPDEKPDKVPWWYDLGGRMPKALSYTTAAALCRKW
jgi:hypothetical protein